jgi:hypothetical protein
MAEHRARKSVQDRVDIVIEYNLGAFGDFSDQYPDDKEFGNQIRKIINKHRG